MGQGPGTNHAINALRFAAAILVAVSHARTLFFVDFSDATDRGLVVQACYLVGSLGHASVLVFFVLSGFWVGGSVIRGVQGNRLDLHLYAISRATRLWIVLLPAIVVTQLADRIGTAAFGRSDVYNATSADYHGVVPVGGPLANLDVITTLGNVFFVQSIHVPPLGTNTPLWSLAYEFWYYLLFPAALLALIGAVGWRWRLIAAGVFVAGAIIAGPAVLALFPVWLAGASLAYFRKPVTRALARMEPRALRALRWVLGLALFGACVATVGLDLNEYASAALVGAAATLYVATLLGDVPPTLPIRTIVFPVARASEWSYSLYAVHLPILAMIAAALIPNASDRWQLSPLTVTVALVIITAVCLLAFGMYMLTERHTTRVRRTIAAKIPKRQGSRATGQSRAGSV